MADPVFVDDVTPLNAVNMNKLQTRDEKAAANGYPSLDATGKVPTAQLPAMGGGADLSFDGDWAAGTYQDGDVVVKDGQVYLCVGGPTAVAPDPAPWGGLARPSMSPAELAYAEVTSPLSITAAAAAAAQTVLTLPPLSLDGQTTILVEFFSHQVGTAAVVAGQTVVTLWDGSTEIGANYGQIATPAAASTSAPFRLARRLTPSAGSHTYSVRAWVSGGGTGIVSAQGNTPTFIRVSVVNSPIPNFPVSTLPVGYGTTLPSAPANGQEHILVDSLTAPTYQWRFRYNAGASGTYKWEFIGGASAKSVRDTSEQVSAVGSWTDAGTPGPDFAVPRAGDYDFEFSLRVVPTAGATNYYGVANASLSATPVGQQVTIWTQATGWTTSVFGMTRITAMSAGHIARLKYQTSAAAAPSVDLRVLKVTPVRVA